MNDDLTILHANEAIMLDEADEWYGKWRDALEKFGHRDDYWQKIINITERFADKYADTPCKAYAEYLMTSRVKTLDAEWQKIRNDKGIDA